MEILMGDFHYRLKFWWWWDNKRRGSNLWGFLTPRFNGPWSVKTSVFTEDLVRLRSSSFHDGLTLPEFTHSPDLVPTLICRMLLHNFRSSQRLDLHRQVSGLAHFTVWWLSPIYCSFFFFIYLAQLCKCKWLILYMKSLFSILVAFSPVLWNTVN